MAASNALNIAQAGLAYFDGVNAFSGIAGATGTILSGVTGMAPTFTADPVVSSITVDAPSVSGATTIVNNSRAGQASYTDTINAATVVDLTLTNSLITPSSVINANVSCATANTACIIVNTAPGTGSVVFSVYNLSGINSASNIIINYSILN